MKRALLATTLFLIVLSSCYERTVRPLKNKLLKSYIITHSWGNDTTIYEYEYDDSLRLIVEYKYPYEERITYSYSGNKMYGLHMFKYNNDQQSVSTINEKGLVTSRYYLTKAGDTSYTTYEYNDNDFLIREYEFNESFSEQWGHNSYEYETIYEIDDFNVTKITETYSRDSDYNGDTTRTYISTPIYSSELNNVNFFKNGLSVYGRHTKNLLRDDVCKRDGQGDIVEIKSVFTNYNQTYIDTQTVKIEYEYRY